MNTATPPQLPVTIIAAGAGSGKTYTLTERMVALLRDGVVRPECIVATTFTRKAAAELQERVRVKLLQCGMSEAADALGASLIGTVHSIGIRLLQRFAFEAGVSPLVEVIADGDEQRLFNESLAQALSESRIERLNLLAERLGLTKKNFDAPFDWRRDIRLVTDVARANNFTAEILEESRVYSWQSFKQFLPETRDITLQIANNQLLVSLEQCAESLENNEADTTVVSRNAAATFRETANRLRRLDGLNWYEWAKIAKTKTSKKSEHLAAELIEMALAHESLPAFQQDIHDYIDLIFEVATDALGEYERYKRRRGLIDYTDMEAGVSRLLRLPQVRDTLAGEIDLLLVDEFQDTSPIQLDIFIQLSRLARHSIWVGDPKQSIYGFRGAEPALMKAVVEAVGGVKDENILKKSWRSRPLLVETVNAIFTRAFTELPPEQIVLAPANPDPTSPPEGLMHPLHHWHILQEEETRKTPGGGWFEQALALQIRQLLREKNVVYDKKTKQYHPLQPGHIAVLCRSNFSCSVMAEALHRAGLKASVARVGLLETPEIRLVLAYLKRIVNPNDRLSAWEIQLIGGQNTLERLIEDAIAGLESHERLTEFIRSGESYGVSEILAQIISKFDIRREVTRLGNAELRLDNIEQLRRLAREYESACDRIHSAATVGGFLIWLDQLADNEADTQAAGESEDAVKVTTYHRSKGLEFPVVVCLNLDQSLREQVFGLQLVAEKKPDLDRILDGRKLRFWVNPYGDQQQGTRLMERIGESEVFLQARRAAMEEETRLLYVGFTRARDMLVWPTAARKQTDWLNRVFSNGNDDAEVLQCDDSDTQWEETPFYTAAGAAILCRRTLAYYPARLPEYAPDPSDMLFHAPHRGRIARSTLFIDPSTEPPPNQAQEPPLEKPVSIAPWLEFSPEIAPQVLSRVLQSAFRGWAKENSTFDNLQAVKRRMAVSGIKEGVGAEALEEHIRSIHQWIASQFSPAQMRPGWIFETVCTGAEGKRRLRFEPDIALFFENSNRIACIWWGPYAEGMKKWAQYAQPFARQMAWMRYAFPDKQIEGRLIFPLNGQVLTL